jgi:diguanylate cyclase
MTRLRPALVGAVVVGAVGYLLVLLLDTGSRTAVVVDDLGNLTSPVIAATACAFAARRVSGRLRASWALLGCFAATWALGQAAWCWYGVVLREPVPFPGPPDIGYLLSVPFAVAALLVHPLAPRAATGRLRLLTDGVLVASGLMALSWRLALGESMRASGADPLAQALALAYPVLDVVLVTVIVLIATRAGRTAGRPLALAAAALVCGAVGHVVYGVMALAGTWVPGNPVDAAWGWGFLLLAAGAASQRPGVVAPDRDRVPGLLAGALPNLPLAAALTLAVVDRVQGRVADRVLGILIILAVVTASVRQLSALLENSRLTRDLERIVEERTAELRRLAETDPLTGLPNRTLLFERVSAATAAGPTAVALLDLDGFKAVNDSLGHAAGDELLVEVARRLRLAVPRRWTVARLGGDEFAVVMPGIGAQAGAARAVEDLLAALGGPVLVHDRTVSVTASVGVVVAAPGDSPTDLLRNADVAMYAAKDEGRASRVAQAGTGRVFVPAMREELLHRVALESDLRDALAAGEVVPHYQPVVELPGGGVRGVEALARWTRADGSTVPPGVFIPLAEESGLVGELGRAVLLQACRDLGAWHRLVADGLLPEAPTLSVNVSAVQLASPSLVEDVRLALAAGDIPAGELVVEITETAVVRDVDAAAERLAQLRDLGVRIALDDFGTGYSALGVLQRLPVDIVKIDRAFVAEVHRGPREAALATAVLALAASLGLTVVAEGIELQEQADRLAELGCGLGQGFLFSKALPAEALVELLVERTPTTPYLVPR